MLWPKPKDCLEIRLRLPCHISQGFARSLILAAALSLHPEFWETSEWWGSFSLCMGRKQEQRPQLEKCNWGTWQRHKIHNAIERNLFKNFIFLSCWSLQLLRILNFWYVLSTSILKGREHYLLFTAFFTWILVSSVLCLSPVFKPLQIIGMLY